MKKFPLVRFCLVALPAIVAAQAAAESKARDRVRFRGIAESGFLAVLSHHVQFGKNGTDFDYVEDGGQDVLYPVSRFSLEAEAGRHTVILLYQPLLLVSEEPLRKDVVFDDLAFPDSTGIRCIYGFPFYRASYLFQLFRDNQRSDFAAGVTLQIRNARIVFESADASRLRRKSGVGLVPALKVRGRTRFRERFFMEVEADIPSERRMLVARDSRILGLRRTR
jgi:hypothetical protein